MKSEWAIALQKHIFEKFEPAPAGWKTVIEISKEMKMTRGYAGKSVSKLIKLGLAEKKYYRVLIVGKIKTSSRMVPHYRLLPKAKLP
jgi:predicted transcriptional regulator